MQESREFDPGVLRYSLELADVISFQQFHLRNSPSQRWQTYFAVVVAIVSAVFLLRDSLARFSFWVNLVVILIAVLIALWVWKILLSWLVGFQTRRLLKEGSNEGLLGPRDLEIANGFLIERTAVNENRQLTSKIDRILETDDFAFIYLSSLQAHVIPKRRIQQGDLDAFLKQLRNAKQRS